MTTGNNKADIMSTHNVTATENHSRSFPFNIQANGAEISGIITSITGEIFIYYTPSIVSIRLTIASPVTGPRKKFSAWSILRRG